jgi:hypothetical protein
MERSDGQRVRTLSLVDEDPSKTRNHLTYE